MSKCDLLPIDTNSKQHQAGRSNNKCSKFNPGLQFYCFTEDYVWILRKEIIDVPGGGETTLNGERY